MSTCISIFHQILTLTSGAGATIGELCGLRFLTDEENRPRPARSGTAQRGMDRAYNRQIRIYRPDAGSVRHVAGADSIGC